MLPFAKRGDDRSNNLVRLQQLFPRIVAADYEQPKRVSEDCRHLLKRMLTPDPAKRVTIPEIMQHPWCGCAPPLSLCSLAHCPEDWGLHPSLHLNLHALASTRAAAFKAAFGDDACKRAGWHAFIPTRHARIGVLSSR